jgi:hypothetical protein
MTTVLRPRREIEVVSVAFGRASARRCTGYTFDDCYNFGSNVTNVVKAR